MDSLLQYEMETNSPTGDIPYPDPNNNNDYESSNVTNKEDKYSLRPRSVRRAVTETHRAKSEQKASRSASNATATTTTSSAATTKTCKSHKPKQKPAPLSKYRRKTANARERNRMREINQAFEALRRVIPQMASSQQQQQQQLQHVPGSNEKLTKITTLRLAMKYISTLSATLNSNGNGQDIALSLSSSSSSPGTTLSDYNDLDCLLLESDGESLPLSDHSLLASPDFPETSLSPVDFGDPTLPPFLNADFSDHSLEPSDFSDFLLT